VVHVYLEIFKVKSSPMLLIKSTYLSRSLVAF
jgi:hypothetical protein